MGKWVPGPNADFQRNNQRNPGPLDPLRINLSDRQQFQDNNPELAARLQALQEQMDALRDAVGRIGDGGLTTFGAGKVINPGNTDPKSVGRVTEKAIKDQAEWDADQKRLASFSRGEKFRGARLFLKTFEENQEGFGAAFQEVGHVAFRRFEAIAGTIGGPLSAALGGLIPVFATYVFKIVQQKTEEFLKARLADIKGELEASTIQIIAEAEKARSRDAIDSILSSQINAEIGLRAQGYLPAEEGLL